MRPKDPNELLKEIPEDFKKKTLHGTPEEIFFDDEKQFYTLIMSKEKADPDDEESKDTYHLYMGFNKVILKITDFLKDKIDDDSCFAIMQGMAEGQKSFLHQTKTVITKYDVSFEGKPKEVK
mmetsp:Transcript_19002/g.13802  ORF Transcript_19002/g.13802 Transcript_19002/m.13802 type:complete len:122 (+) Transcript_19002:1394-1759(+)